MKKYKHKQKRKGFTLVELIVVIAIIVTLVSFISPKMLGYEKKAKEIKAINTAKQIEAAVKTIYVNYGENDKALIEKDIKDLIDVVVVVDAKTETGDKSNNKLSLSYECDKIKYLVDINIEDSSFIVKYKDKDKTIYPRKIEKDKDNEKQ